ncbi:MAG: hypothetical protein V4544_04885 [Pseudomonadota bacterium]
MKHRYILRLLIILSIQFSAVTAIASDQETDTQRTVREVYSVLNGSHYEFSAPDEGGHPTSLPENIFEKRINEKNNAPSFYSRNTVLPADAIEQLITPKSGETHYIECNIAASICQNALFMHALGGEDYFNHFSLNASATWKTMCPSEPSYKFLSNIVLSNKADENENFANDLLIAPLPLKGGKLDLTKLSTGDILSLENDSLYYHRHPYGRCGAENVVFYGFNEDRKPLFFGFKGIFEDGKPHTLNEIQIAMLEDFLKEPNEFENNYHAYYPLSSDVSDRIEKQITVIKEIGNNNLASEIYQPEIGITLATENIERIKTIIGGGEL